MENKRGKKLYYYLSKLKEKELHDFHDYLLSPLLGNSPQFARMLLIMQDKVLATGRNTIDADLFQEEFFPGQPLDEKKTKYIRIRLVQFLDKVLEFASFMDYRSDRNARDIHLLKAMRTRGWEKHFERVHAEVEAKPAIKKDGEYLMYKLWRAVVMDDFLAERVDVANAKNLNKVIEGTDDLFIHLRMKYACGSLNTSIHGGETIPSNFLNEVINIGKERNWDHTPESHTYLHAYLMLRSIDGDDDEGDWYYEKVKLFLKNPPNSDSSELIDLFFFANNYCQIRFRKGAYSFRKEITDLYDVILRNGALAKAGTISKALYKNFVTNTCRMGEVKWAESFVEDWKDKIAGDEKHLAYFHNKAHIYLFHKEYDKTIELLYNRIHLYEDAMYGLSARVNICRALWEKGDYQWLNSNLEAMRQFILRLKTLGKNEKSAHEKFMRYLSRMSQAKSGSPDQTKEKLRKIYAEMIDNKDHNRLIWVHKVLKAEIEQSYMR